MWPKKYEDKNADPERIQELHTKLKEEYGEKFIEVFDYIPAEDSSEEEVPYVELRFDEEISDLERADELVDAYKV